MRLLGSLFIIVSMLAVSVTQEDQFRDVYDIRIYAYMPRIYDNMQSLGKRKYQRQLIVGQMYITYGQNDQMDIRFSQFTNKTHMISQKHVTYDVSLSEDSLSSFSWCGDNSTLRFDRPNCNFTMIMVPSYKIGSEMLDNVYLSIACVRGTSRKTRIGNRQATIPYSLNGYCTGQIGCNCTAWGHTSPTRYWGYWGPSQYVTDVASVSGSVKMRWNKNASRK